MQVSGYAQNKWRWPGGFPEAPREARTRRDQRGQQGPGTPRWTQGQAREAREGPEGPGGLEKRREEAEGQPAAAQVLSSSSPQQAELGQHSSPLRVGVWPPTSLGDPGGHAAREAGRAQRAPGGPGVQGGKRSQRWAKTWPAFACRVISVRRANHRRRLQGVLKAS